MKFYKPTVNFILKKIKRTMWLVPFAILSQLCLVFYAFVSFPTETNSTWVLSDPYIWKITLFSLKQACLSAFIALLLAIPTALSLAFTQGKRRRFILSLMSLCFLISPLIVVIMLVSVWGNAGWIGGFAREYFIDWNFYGLSGILMAHVFLNWPYLARLLLQAIESTPGNYWKQSLSMGLTKTQLLRYLVWPRLKVVALYGFGLVFIYCFNSFAIVLALGGGPASTTLEVAIFQAIKYEFDFDAAVQLAMVQLAFSVLVLVATQFPKRVKLSAGMSTFADLIRWRFTLGLWASPFWYRLLLFFILLPFFSLMILPIIRDANVAILWHASTLNAVLYTLYIYLLVSALVLGLCAVLLPLRWSVLQQIEKNKSGSASAKITNKLKNAVIIAAIHQPLLLPALLSGVGLWLLLHTHINVFDWSLYLIAGISALVCLPLIMQVVWPVYSDHRSRYDKITASLALSGWQQWQYILWPSMRRSILRSLVMLFMLVSGEVGLIALFGNQDVTTIAWYMYSLMGQYRMADAALLALVQLFILVWLFWRIEKQS
jgi:thiamine transport system permease protein